MSLQATYLALPKRAVVITVVKILMQKSVELSLLLIIVPTGFVFFTAKC